jgi:NAD(P)-dependent dehydrogenase (short-subunit alcohol dehydrogenase family)
MDQLTLTDQVAIVTGAGRGLGRAHSLELARRGAAVVVNDISREYADEVVAEIEAAGGAAAPSYDSVATPESAEAIVGVALEQFGTVDAVVNNAGFMRNGYFEDLTPERLKSLLAVHIEGSFYVTQAAWPIMREKGYGRVVMTSSAGGLFAFAGESNYAAAKGGAYGLMKALAFEGAQHGILVNAILPMATTTITADDPVPDYEKYYPSDVRDFLAPRRTTEMVAPLVAYLCSRACAVSSEAFSAGFGRYARVFVGETRGWVASDPESITAEDVLEHLEEIRDRDDYTVPANIFDEVKYIAAALGMTAAR